MLVYFIVAVAGFVAGVAVLFVVKVRSGPDLQPWHRVRLESEFTAGKARSRVGNFEAYLKLEDKLFAELDEQIYRKTPQGTAQALVRYSRGSLSDPNTWERNWNRTFEFPVAEPVGGILLVHGMSDSPYSLHSLAEMFHKKGYWVIGLRLPGHGTVPAGLLSVTAEDMNAAVRLAAAHLASKTEGKPLHIVGYSTGAALALDYTLSAIARDAGALTVPKSLILISPSIAIMPAAAFAKWARRLSCLPGLGKLAWTGILPEFDPYKYNSFTANAGDQVYRLTKRLASRLSSMAAEGPIKDFPHTLVFLSAADATISPAAVVDHLLKYFVPGRHELVLFDVNRNRVKSSILIEDPGPLTTRLLQDASLPFRLTLIGNRSPESGEVVARMKEPGSTEVTVTHLNTNWPPGVISLSHVALPFSPKDPLYGRRAFVPEGHLGLGEVDMKGERNLLTLPADWLIRLRYNPFYDYLAARSLDWIESDATARGGS